MTSSGFDLKIVSGAQTGVDRGALDAALAVGAACGGWCPEGRMAEDGVIPERYPVKELPDAGYRQRTRKNVQDSDATLIIYFRELTGGTQQTLKFCMNEKQPYLLIDAEEISVQRAAERVQEFVLQYEVRVLNVAGPRGGREPRAHPYTQKVITLLYETGVGSFSAT